MKNDKSMNEDRARLYELIDDIELSMLVTQSSDGSLRSRPMVTRVFEGDPHLWFLTDKDSAKVIEIENDKHVNVSFAKPGERAFVSISGIAHIVDDRDVMEKVWSPSAQIWYPLGKADPRITLIRVTPEIGEYWDAPRGVFVTLYELTRAIVTGERPGSERGQHQKVDL